MDSKDVAKTWYVYLLCDPDTEIPFYVGKGTGKRMENHEIQVDSPHSKNQAKNEVIRRILAEGKQVLKKKVEEFELEYDAYELEAKLIKQYKPHLTNIVGMEDEEEPVPPGRARLVIKEIAAQKKLNQCQLQLKSGVSLPLLSRYWHNKTTSVTLDALERIAEVLEVEPGSLIVKGMPASKATKKV